ncbi:MAG: biotin/lipoyl-binding protein, partial [Leifsonia sp.]
MRKRRVIVGGALGLTAVLIGGGLAVAANSAPAANYRTAIAQPETVRQTVALTGPISSSTRRTVAFAVRGTIATVVAQPGQQVHAGDTLASLDPSALQSALQSAQQNASSVEQTLA